MKALITAVVVVFAVGVVAPAAAEARSPEARKAWGCHFTTKAPGFFTEEDEKVSIIWSAVGKLGGCDRTRTFIVKTSVWQYVDDGPNVRIDERRHVTTVHRRGTGGAWDGALFASSAKGCIPRQWEPPVAGAPFYGSCDPSVGLTGPVGPDRARPGRAWRGR